MSNKVYYDTLKNAFTIQNVPIKQPVFQVLLQVRISLQYKMFLLNLIFSKLLIQYTTFPHFCRYQYFHIFLPKISFYFFIKQSENPIKINITENLSMSRLFGVIPDRQILFKRSLKFYHLRLFKIPFPAIFLYKI